MNSHYPHKLEPEDNDGHAPSRFVVDGNVSGRAGDQPSNGASADPSDESRTETLHGPRSRPRIRRTIIAVVVGIIFLFLFNWRVGLGAAIIAAIADTVYTAKTASTVAAWRKIGASERKTEHQLRGMRRSGYRALHARAIPDSDAQIDHLVVGPTGVYAVDSENWDRRLPVRAMSHRKLFLGPYDQKARLDEARWEADEAKKLISSALDIDIDVRPSLAIYGPAIPWNVLTIRDVDVYTGGRLRKYLKKQPKFLSPDEIDKIYRTADRMLPQRYGEDVEAPN